MKFKQVTHRPLFWIIQIFIFAICLFLSFTYYPKAFPIIDLQITMNRKSALESASQMAKNQHWGPEKYQQAVSFDLDSQTQNFIELTGGGTKAFSQVLKEGLYSPYTWRIRHFAEGSSTETHISFTPDGKFYGFFEKLPENAPGKALSADQALKIAEQAATQNWNIDLSAYHLEEKSQEAQPSGRIDHTFVYERPHIQIGEGRYRLRLSVGGDHLTELSYFIKIPDAFSRKYTEMRSANNTITAVASTAMAVLYLLGGCGFGLFYLAKQRYLLWKTPLACAVVVALFQLLEQLNQFPLIWMGYDTALSAQGFIFRNLTLSLVNFFAECILLTLSFMAAESLSRRAFPHHPQLWGVWRTENASSNEILGRTLGGFLGVGPFLAFIVFIYLVGTQHLGWWTPSDALFQPNSLAAYFPWFTALSNSLHAGFWEESLFRAVPLASAALLGERFGHRKKWIGAGMIIQALIFAAAHANYPAQPFYARVIELIIPSLGFGTLYLLFGLLPGIILHFTFDVVMFSIPIFAADTPKIWIDQSLVILFTLIPLWICLIARAKQGRWHPLSPNSFNQAWRPSLQIKSEPPDQGRIIKPIPRLTSRQAKILGALSVACLIILMVVPRSKSLFPSLETQKAQALQLARKTLEDSGVHLSHPWQALASISSDSSEEDRFIWKTAGPNLYQKLVGTYLSPPSWIVRFVRFDADVAERAEEYEVFIQGNHQVYRVRHELPEGRKLDSLDQGEARKVALQAVQNLYSLPAKELKEVSSSAFKLPARTDWIFVFSDPSVHLTTGDARVGVRIAGNQAISSRRYIFVPEDWSRQERNQQNLLSIIRIFSGLFVFSIFSIGVVLALFHWLRKEFEYRTFLTSFFTLSILGLLDLINNLPARYARFSTQEPLMNQWITLFASGVVMVLVFSISCSLVLSYLHYKCKQSITPLENPRHLYAGYAIGVIGAALSSLLHKVLPQIVPTRGSLNGFDYAIPVLAGFGNIKNYILVTLVLLFLGFLVNEKITLHWTRRRTLGGLLLLCFGFAGSGMTEPTLQNGFIAGAFYGFYFLIILRYWMKSHLSLIPLATAAASILVLVRQILLHPYSGSTSNSVITGLVILLLSYYWHRRLESKWQKE